ncbi:hypothetical protein PMm318_A51010 [Pseudomonas moorei]
MAKQRNDRRPVWVNNVSVATEVAPAPVRSAGKYSPGTEIFGAASQPDAGKLARHRRGTA